MKKHFKAPWSTKLKLMTTGIVSFSIYQGLKDDKTNSKLLLSTLCLTGAFAVRGYDILDNELIIQRVGWPKKFDLSKLQHAEFNPGATSKTIRTFGVGGLFGFTGYFYSSQLGIYRSYATNWKNTVVLDFGGKKVVVTPEKPEEFVNVVKQAK